MNPDDTEEQIEEILERLWTLREQSGAAPPDLTSDSFRFDPAAAIADARRRNWLTSGRERPQPDGDGERRAAASFVDIAWRSACCSTSSTWIRKQWKPVRVNWSIRTFCRRKRPTRLAFLGHPPTAPTTVDSTRPLCESSRRRCNRWSPL